MRMLKRLVVLSAALVTGVTAAAAGGDLRGSIKDDYAPAPVVHSWYLRADVGHAWQNADALWVHSPALASSKVDDTRTFGVGIGRYFGRGFRGDVSYEWRGKTSFDAISTNCCATSTHFDMKSQVVLANVYYDFRPMGRIKPYIGAGIGAAYNETFGGSYPGNTCGCTPYDGKAQWNLAWALMAGGSMAIDTRTHFDMGYRYINIGEVVTGPNRFDGKAGPYSKELDAHELRFGIRYDLR